MEIKEEATRGYGTVSQSDLQPTISFIIYKLTHPYPATPFYSLKETTYLQGIISLVLERGERPSTGLYLYTSSDGESHDLWVGGGSMYVCKCTRGQWLTSTMDNNTFNSLFHCFPYKQSRPTSSRSYSLFRRVLGEKGSYTCCSTRGTTSHICLTCT